MNFFSELNRRNVVRVGVAYPVAGWVLTQVAGSLEAGLSEARLAAKEPQ